MEQRWSPSEGCDTWDIGPMGEKAVVLMNGTRLASWFWTRQWNSNVAGNVGLISEQIWGIAWELPEIPDESGTFSEVGVPSSSAGGKELERSGKLLSMQSYLSPGNVWFADLAEALQKKGSGQSSLMVLNTNCILMTPTFILGWPKMFVPVFP